MKVDKKIPKKAPPAEILRSEDLANSFVNQGKEFNKPHAGGRPEVYRQKLADKICEKIAEGYSLRTACKGEGMPALSTVFLWFRTKPEFSDQYAKATQERTEAMAEDILDIADDGSNDLMTIQKGNLTYEIENKEVTNRSKLRVDTRKWLMSKMKPRKYGEKLDVTTDGKALPTPIYGGKSTGEV